MSQTLKNLPTLSNLEKTEEEPFRGQSEDLSLRQILGGQIVDQVLYAAEETVPDERLMHSFHSYFLRPGDSRKPIIYDVETLRDDNSSSARRVSAIQNGKPIFYITASFQTPEADFKHQKTMSSAPTPDGLPSETRIAQSLVHLLPPVLKDKFVYDRPPGVRPVEFHSPLKGHIAEPHRQMRTCTNGSVPDDLHVHQYLLGCTSDPNFLPIALQPHGIGFLGPGIQIAAISHSMWFHCPSNLNEWLLYSVESTSAPSACGFMRGELYAQDDVLAASVVQEGAMRNRN